MLEVLNENMQSILESDILEREGLTKGKYFLMSIHREENVDSPKNFENLLNAIDAITKKYKLEHLLGFQVIAIVNFPKKQIANFMSECLVLGVVEDDSVVLLKPDSKTENGLRIA